MWWVNYPGHRRPELNITNFIEPAQFVAAFNDEDPGVLSVAQRYFGLPPDIVGAALGGLGVEEVGGLEALIPDNIAVSSSYQRCRNEAYQ